MKHLLAVLLGAGILLVPGCGRKLVYEVALEASGPQGATADATFDLPKPNHHYVQKITLPFKETVVNGHGAVSFRIVPSKGDVSCRIVVEGKQLSAASGKNGRPVECALPANRKWPYPAGS